MRVKGIAVVLFALALAGGMSPIAIGAPGPTITSGVQSETVWHGGGCRKDSLPGQCCHAGSEPYHCH